MCTSLKYFYPTKSSLMHAHAQAKSHNNVHNILYS